MERIMKLSFSTLGCPRWSWDEMLAIAKDLKIDGIEVRGMGDSMYAPELPPFVESAIPDTVNKLKKIGLSIPILTSGAYFADKSVSGSSFSEACAYIDLAEKLGVPYIRVMAEPTPEPQGGDLIHAAIKYGELCDYARGSSVTPLIETNGGLADSTRMKRFLDQAGRENMGVLWDIHHSVRYFGEDPAKTVDALGGLIKHVHIKDSVMKDGHPEYRMMGYGDIPAKEALHCLNDIGYSGFVSLEWVKRWNPDLEEPGIVFAHFCNYMNYLVGVVKKA